MFTSTGRLSWDVKTPKSSLGAYLRKTFPNIRPIQAAYKADAGKLLIKGSGQANSGTIGAGIDLAYRIMLEPGYVPEEVYWFFPFNERYKEAVIMLSNFVAFTDDDEARAQAIWGLGYLVNGFRAGPVHAPDVFAMVRDEKFEPLWLMFLGKPPALREITSLWKWGKKRLAPKVSGPITFAPTFDLSTPSNEDTQLIAAEADLVANGTLIDIKTSLGSTASDGSRYDALKGDNLYQLLGYVLLDYSNRYSIEKVGLYSARYGKLHTWPLDELFAVAAGDSFSPEAARQEVWDLMHEEYEPL